ncbi:hypothetical protein Tco_0465741 [Tanacetum coccineum]
MERGFLSQKGSGGIGVSTESDDTMNEDTSVGVASPVKEGVTPSVVDMMVEKEKICPLEDTIVLEFFPTLTMLVTTMAGNAPGRSSYARVIIELQADVELKDNIVMVMPKITREGHYTCNVCVEYEWKPPRCSSCKVFGHIHEECPKNTGAGEKKIVKKPSQTS